jgi:hypothetical protein
LVKVVFRVKAAEGIPVIFGLLHRVSVAQREGPMSGVPRIAGENPSPEEGYRSNKNTRYNFLSPCALIFLQANEGRGKLVKESNWQKNIKPQQG